MSIYDDDTSPEDRLVKSIVRGLLPKTQGEQECRCCHAPNDSDVTGNHLCDYCRPHGIDHSNCDRSARRRST